MVEKTESMKPIVAIVGRPNVGKSTFFNRLTRTKDALVDDLPGVTRDRHYGDVHWNEAEFTLIDTGGYTETDDDAFSGRIRSQLTAAIDEADVIIFMLDGKTGVSPFDKEGVALLRKSAKPAFYVVNKIDGYEKEGHLYDFYCLGIEPLFPVSAEHGYGVPDFLDELVGSRPDFQPQANSGTAEEVINLAVVGRPNVGKSSLINKMLGQERLVVSAEPGTTRDAIDTLFRINGRSYRLIDTAGIRRKGRVSRKLEKFSVIKALRSLDRCDVALIVLDAGEGITDQDVTVAGYAYERGCGCIFALNKWDLMGKDDASAGKYVEKLKASAKFLNFAPAVTLSARTGLRIPRIFKLTEEIYQQYMTRVGTGRLNKIIEQATLKTEPALYRGRRIKFFYATQTATGPPTFVCFVNYPRAVHFSYKRYLINQIRLETGLVKIPIRLICREKRGRRSQTSS